MRFGDLILPITSNHPGARQFSVHKAGDRALFLLLQILLVLLGLVLLQPR